MIIEPNSKVWICRDIPLDNSYEHTIAWGLTTNQTDYFLSKVKKVNGVPFAFNNVSYQRVSLGKIRLQKPVNDLYDCNYMVFQNTGFGNKYFYAFINNVEYVNNVTSEITYEIDVLQTWWFEAHPCDCFIERQTPAIDRIGNNLVDEGLELGDYITSTQGEIIKSLSPDGYDPLFMVLWGAFSLTEDGATNKYEGKYLSGLYCGINGLATPCTPDGTEAANLVISWLGANANAMVCISTMPRIFATAHPGDEPIGHTFNVPGRPFKGMGIDGYVPKNMKLYTYPYYFFTVSTPDGSDSEYKYEYFDANNDVTLRLTCNMAPDTQVVLWPRHYRGELDNWDEKLMLTGFPMLPYSTDTYRAWLAQHETVQRAQLISTGASALGGLGQMATGAPLAAMGNPVGMLQMASGATQLSSAFSNVMGILAQRKQAEVLPRAAHKGGASTMTAMRKQDFFFHTKSVRAEFARIIDDYFTKYGYAMHIVATPNLHARTEWTFIKTRGAKVDGRMPNDARRAWEQILDNGLTVWEHANHVGNYSLENEEW